MVSGASDGTGFDPRARSRGLISTAFWSILCLLIFLWWASHYSSLVEWLGEWQFAHLGSYYPSVTVVLCIAILVAPILLFVLFRRRRRRLAAEREAPLTSIARLDIAINAAERGRVFFIALAGVSLVCACWALLSLLSLPDLTRSLQTISSASADSVVQGPARFAPGRSIGQVALLTENAALVERDTYIAPVTLDGDRGREARFFTEVERLAGAPPSFTTIPRGVLRADGVPRELVNLYRAAGVGVVNHPYLLVSDVAKLRWRPLVLAAQLLLLTLLAGIASLLLRRQARRLRRKSGQRDIG